MSVDVMLAGILIVVVGFVAYAALTDYTLKNNIIGYGHVWRREGFGD